MLLEGPKGKAVAMHRADPKQRGKQRGEGEGEGEGERWILEED